MPLWLPLIPVKKMSLPPPLTTRAQAEEHPRVKTHRKPPLHDAAGIQHSTTTQSEEQVQVSMATADDWSAFAEDLNADTQGPPLFTTPTTRETKHGF